MKQNLDLFKNKLDSLKKKIIELAHSFNLNNYIVYVVLFCVFICPTYSLHSLFKIDVVKYLFFIISMISYGILIIKGKKISTYEIALLISIALICLMQQSIVPLHLIELLVIYKLIEYLYNEKDIISNKHLFISILGIIFYSIIYFGLNGRYLYTGLREINQSSFAILLLAILIRKKNVKFGNVFLALGLLTFSRNYLLGVLIFIVLETIKKTRIYDLLYKIFNFKNITIISIILLIIISIVFEIAYKHGKLVEYKEGFARYIYVFDYSNYFRFSTNTNLIKVYAKHPVKLLTGLEEEEYYNYSKQIAKENNKLYRPIKPHNYFFSYFRIYGIFSICIFWFLNLILKKVITKNNFSIFMVIFVYASLLGIGFANYWLFLSVITLLVYKGDEKNDGCHNNNKNISKKKSVNKIIKVN